jgi:ABC-2 type transport system permease protein
LTSAGKFVSSALAIAEMEARKIRHDSSELWMSAIQPALWLVVFGSALTELRSSQLTEGNYTYLQFMSAGIIAQSVLFVAILYGVRLIWERDMGILTKLLATPSPRSAVVVGKTLASSVRGLFMAIVVLGITLVMGINLRLDPLDVLGVFAVVILFSMAFTAFSMMISSFLQTQNRMMAFGQALTMPLFFASNAIYPISLMPSWLQVISKANPLSYVVDAMRSMILTGDYSQVPLDIAAIGIFTILMMVAASIVLRKLVQ